MQTVLAWSICRSLIITAIAMPLSLSVWRLTQATSENHRSHVKWLLIAALLPLFVPDLLTGFCYRLTAARLIHSTVATECLYGGLLLFRVVALQVAVCLVLPVSAVGAESMHAWKLLPQRNLSWWLSWSRMLLVGPWRTTVVEFIAGALLCFQEFETAALLQVDRHPITFTVWLFDAHAAGETLSQSLRFVTGAVTFQLTLLLPAAALLTVQQRQIAGPQPACCNTNVGLKARIPALTIIAAGLFCVLIWPIISHINGVANGLVGLVSQGSFGSRVTQILASLSVSAISASLALLLAIRLLRLKSRWGTLVTLLPGLCGALVLSISLLALFQLPGFHLAYDSWIPMISGAALLMVPRAFLLVLLLNVSAGVTTQHSGTLLMSGDANNRTTGKSLRWYLVQRRWLLAMAVLTHWSFWDVTVASVLRPVRFEPVVTRLYNEMHYGRTELLVAITFLALLVPILVMSAIALLLKFVPHMKKAA